MGAVLGVFTLYDYWFSGVDLRIDSLNWLGYPIREQWNTARIHIARSG